MVSDLGQFAAIMKDHEVTAVAFMDMGNFKAVNDRLGHTTEGDKCLEGFVAVASRIAAGKARLYRDGGDEFVLVFPNFTAREAVATAERIRRAVADARIGDEIEMTASIGVASSEDFRDADSLLASVEERAKSKGR